MARNLSRVRQRGAVGVRVGDQARNDRMIEEVLLSRVNMPSEHSHRIPAELAHEGGARRYAQRLQCAQASDIAVLSVGCDGHAAGLFPSKSIALFACFEIRRK